jgi:ribosomal protein L21E
MTYHPQIDVQTKRVNKVMEDMLRMHFMHQPKQWEEYIPLVEFSYNNGNQESLKMIPFEVLYGRKYNVPINWDNPMDKITLSPKMLKDMGQTMIKIKYNLKIAQDRQKRYEDIKRSHKEFKVGDHVYLRVNPKRSSLRMGSFAKLSPHYRGPFEVLERVEPITYRLPLPPTIKDQTVFHVPLLNKYVHNSNHVIDWTMIQVEPEG